MEGGIASVPKFSPSSSSSWDDPCCFLKNGQTSIPMPPFDGPLPHEPIPQINDRMVLASAENVTRNRDSTQVKAFQRQPTGQSFRSSNHSR